MPNVAGHVVTQSPPSPSAQGSNPPAANGVRLAQAAENVHNAIAMGSRNGVSIARIQLSPASLGSIQIHLQHTDEGVVARVVTEHPETAETLLRSSDDLRQSLQQSGTHLLRLDIQTSDQQSSTAQRQPLPTPDATGRRHRAAVDREGDGETAAATSPIALHGLTGASLVNVLA